MDLHLKDKVIIVTGGAKGIGFATAEVLAKEGATVCIIGRNSKDNEAAVQEINTAGGNVSHVIAELTRPAECEKATNDNDCVILMNILLSGLCSRKGAKPQKKKDLPSLRLCANIFFNSTHDRGEHNHHPHG